MSEIEQITNPEHDERYYLKDGKYAPSVTHILSVAYPTAYGLMDWKGDVGNKRAQEIMEDAGQEGTFVHNAIERILLGETVNKSEIDKIFKPKRGLKIKRSLKAFLDWFEEMKPKTIQVEKTIWESELLYAGTLDYICEINGEMYIVDFKTSNSINDKMRVQLSAYNYAETKGAAKQALLHLGNGTKKRYSFLPCEFEKYFRQFEIANKLYKELKPDAKPSQEIFPDDFKI